jgi:hypothetical protein
MKLYETPPAERAMPAPETPADGPCLPILLRVPRLTPEDAMPSTGRGIPSIGKAAVLGLVIAATVGLWLLRWHAWVWPDHKTVRAAVQQVEEMSSSVTPGEGAVPSAGAQPSARLAATIVPVDGGGSP